MDTEAPRCITRRRNFRNTAKRIRGDPKLKWQLRRYRILIPPFRIPREVSKATRADYRRLPQQAREDDDSLPSIPLGKCYVLTIYSKKGAYRSIRGRCPFFGRLFNQPRCHIARVQCSTKIPWTLDEFRPLWSSLSERRNKWWRHRVFTGREAGSRCI
jgi:hypothetical protein